MRKSLWLGCLALLPCLAFASQVDVRIAKDDPCGRLEVVHVNGVRTLPADAQDNLTALAALYGNGHNGHIIVYRLAYNQADGVVGDMQEVWLQKLRETPSLTFEVFLRLVTGLIAPDEYQRQMLADIRAFLDTLALFPPIPTDPVLINMAATIRGNVVPKKDKTLIVAHSQGTLYAASAYNMLVAGGTFGPAIPGESMAIVAVGAAAGPLPGTASSWVTSSRDLVIGALRQFDIPGTVAPLASNIRINYSAADWLGHDFIGIYLTAGNSRGAIRRKVEAALTALKSPGPPPARWLLSRSLVRHCPGDPYYWRSCWMSIPAGTFPIVQQQNVIKYSVAGGQDVLRHGEASELADVTKAHAQGCFDLFLTDMQNQKLYGILPHHVIPGCGPAYPWQTPYGQPDDAWMIYSSDGVDIRERAYSEPYIDYYDVETHPVCRRAS